MAITLKRLIVDDLDAIPEEHEGDRHELIDGELTVTPVPIIKHQIASMRLVRYLDRHVEHGNLGAVFSAPTGIRLDQHNLLIPDVWFVTRDRLHTLGVKTMDAPPDLVIEILSPGTRRRDLNAKRELYARFSVPEYWIVDPEEETITVLTLVGSGYELVPAGPGGAVKSRVLPALRLTPDMVFAPIT
jgi:Uma2 family endonuclease